MKKNYLIGKIKTYNGNAERQRKGLMSFMLLIRQLTLQMIIVNHSIIIENQKNPEISLRIMKKCSRTDNMRHNTIICQYKSMEVRESDKFGKHDSRF